MPRPQKDGIDYFPLDVNFFSDPKIKILKARYGADGITVYLYLLCEIYRAGYFLRFNEDILYIISDDLKMSAEKVMQIINFLLDRSLLDGKLFQSDKAMTSAGIQKRFQLAVKERARKKPIEAKGFWLLNEEETEPFIKVNPVLNKSGKNGSKSGKNECYSGELSIKESKGNKSKLNKTISPELKNSPGSEVAYQLLLIDGNDYPVSREEVEKYQKLYPAIDVDQEFRKMIGWLDTHPKNRKTPREIGKFINGWLCRAQDSARLLSGKAQPPNRFHNFEQRDTDYDSMMMDDMKQWIGKEGEKGDG